MIISIHIPKTGGSSFAKVLNEVYADKLWVNYDLQWTPETSGRASIPCSTECLHGHFEFDAFDEAYPGASKITWLRDPVERTISLYHHIMTKPDRQNDLIMEIYHNRPSLVEFSKIPWVSNQAMNYLRGAQASDFKFIGFLEHFEESLGLCGKLLGWNRVPRAVWENRGAGKENFDLSKEGRQSIRENNREEYEWREEAKRLFLSEEK
jgi:hypothetical protein